MLNQILRMLAALMMLTASGGVTTLISAATPVRVLAATVDRSRTQSDRNKEVYPKAGKIVLGLPHWDANSHRFRPIKPRECDIPVAAFQPGNPLSWVARLRRHHDPKISLEIFRVRKNHQVVARVLTRTVKHSPHKPLIHTVVTNRRLRALHITPRSGKLLRYRLDYRTADKTLAVGYFKFWNRPPTAFGY